jgi:beta-lactam-binding protein with PASTA domain
VPRLKGKTLKAAEHAIRTRNCTVGKITHAPSQTVKKGRVISQKPRPSRHLQHGAKVNIRVSTGRRQHR